jgi:anti-sigma B factor antagonist
MIEIQILANAQAVLRPTGRFDAHEAPEFQRALAEAKLASPSLLAVDLSEVNFIDSTALAELVSAHREFESVGGAFRLWSPTNPVRVILEVTRLAAFFVVEETPAEAKSVRT